MPRVDEVGRLDHVVLLVAAQAVLRAEGGAERQVGQGGERIERVGEVAGDRGRVGKERDPATGERAAQLGIGEQAVEAEANGVHAASAAAVVRMRTKPSR